MNELINVRKNVKLPILIGSGITKDNLHKYFSLADGFIVGSYFKIKGFWKNKIDKQRVRILMSEFNSLKN